MDRARLSRTRFSTVRWFEEVGSTNTELVEAARQGEPEGLVAVADHQTAGRGRLGRRWSAAPGSSLLMSVLLRPPLPIDDVQPVLMAAGLATADAVEAAAGFRPGLKWPNDLITGGRKLSGLLAESVDGASGTAGLVVGVGINVTGDAYPPDLAVAATSCEEEAGRPVDRGELFAAFLEALEARYATALAGGGRAATLEAYRKDLATLGRRVRVELPSATVEGEAVGLGPSGELVVADDAGGRITVNVGDVIHLRH